MKTKHIILFYSMLLAGTVMSGCSDEFLKDKRDTTGYSDVLFNSYETAQGKVDYIYGRLLPTMSGQCGGNSYTKSTIEYAGGDNGTIYTNSRSATTYKNVDDNFFKKQSDGPWSNIRDCNDVLEKLEKSTLTQNEKNELMGQVYFWRAWQYWELVKQYGGVPLVLKAQDPILHGAPDASQTDLAVPRSSTTDCIARICEDLDNAINMLPGRWDNNNYGRITSGAAAALKGRILLYYASPVFNRNDDRNRYKEAYNANKQAYDLLTNNGFGLDGQSTMDSKAKNWEQMFLNITSKEGVMVTLFNTETTDSYKKNNGWEQSSRPAELEGNGGQSATLEMLDLFPMNSGLPAVDNDGRPINSYDPLKFYKNRDPRFYRTFAFCGVKWPSAKDREFTVWNYSWFKNQEDIDNAASPSGNGLYQGSCGSNIFLRKYTNPDAEFSDNNKFNLSATPWFEIRFTEVVLNLAEAACGSDDGKLEEAYTLLKSIRQRVGYTGECGLDPAIRANRDKMFAALLYERQIEFAYEGKRFDDMRRWMLYNDDFGTCTRLGVKPLNGQRRHGIYLAVRPEVIQSTQQGIEQDKLNPESPAYDPSLVTREGISLDIDASPAEYAEMESKLDNFYDTNLIRVENDALDGSVQPLSFVDFKNYYYFIGLKESVMKQSPYLEQNVGWTDYYGNEGTFDPLK